MLFTYSKVQYFQSVHWLKIFFKKFLTLLIEIKIIVKILINNTIAGYQDKTYET